MLLNFLMKFLREMMLVIEYLLNRTSCLYPGTVALWVNNRILTLTYTVIFFPALVIFSTRYEFQNRSIVEHLSNNITFFRYNLISFLWLCLNKTSSILKK